jgi:hypothetical protein
MGYWVKQLLAAVPSAFVLHYSNYLVLVLTITVTNVGPPRSHRGHREKFLFAPVNSPGQTKIFCPERIPSMSSVPQW